MKIVCVYNKNYEDERTLYKVYDSLEKLDIKDGQWWFYNDLRHISRAWYKHFMPLAEWREQQINLILND